MKPGLVLVLLLASLPARGETWKSVGPPGGDVRALAADPSRPGILYLGTADGVLYRSDDLGTHWRRMVPGFPERGMSLDEIAVDPQGRVFIGYWNVSGSGGGVARSDDGGASFTIASGIQGESVRAIAVWEKDPSLVVAGTLTGVFRSGDGGQSFQRVPTPAGLRNVESVALDPQVPGTIYAGTWHLPWRSVDGGRTWQEMHDGIIEDSDIFTLTVDKASRSTLYATACTGIYRSLDRGGVWRKVHGIPASSRRTRSFAQDPDHPEVLYAGTTEGLWISEDSGATWRLATTKALVVNSVLVLPGSRVLLGCDGAGVLRSLDGGTSFTATNEGFSERFVSAVVFDSFRQLVGIEGDRQHGGVFARTGDGWKRLGAGLEGREVLALALWDSRVWAGTDDGVYRFREDSGEWSREPALVNGREVHPRVRAFASLPGGGILAATEGGVFSLTSLEGAWEHRTPGLETEFVAVAVSPRDGAVVCASPLGVYRSLDRGQSWERMASPPDPRLHALSFAPGSAVLFAPTPQGLFRSRDQGRTWYRWSGGLPVSDITGLAFHPNGSTVYASDFTWGGLFRSEDGGESWSRLPTDGLVSDRIWTIAVDPASPDRPLVAGRTGGLSVREPPGTVTTR
jgi:photosystem II stability/assembly factor-like uncharacterized protein